MKKKFLIISLHRMGDNLQVTPIFESLKKENPDSEIWVLTEKGFEGVFNENPFLDKVVLFDRSLHSADHFQSLQTLRANLDPALDPIARTDFDLVINRQSSREGALFSALAKGRSRRGFSINEKNEFAIPDPWTRLLFAMIKSRRLDPFQLVDYHIRSAGGLPGLARPWIGRDDAQTSNLISQWQPKGEGAWVALQPGASTSFRQWPADLFAEMARQLLAAEPTIRLFVLVGPAEMELAETIRSGMDSDQHTRLALCDCPLASLSGLLAQCDLLITNDTGPMHIAAAAGTRVLALYFAGSVANEVAPYGEGHILLQAKLDCIPCLDPRACKNQLACKMEITPEAVAAAALFVLRKSTKLASELFSRIDVLQTRQSPGGLECVPLFKRPLSIEALQRLLYRALFLEVLTGQTANSAALANTIESRYIDTKKILNSPMNIDLTPINSFSSSPSEAKALTTRLSGLIGEIRSKL